MPACRVLLGLATVTTKRDEAVESADAAANAATQAATSASQASVAKTQAEGFAQTTQAQATLATSAKTDAAQSASQASTSAGSALAQANIATAKATEATSSATTATNQASTATTKAAEAAASATASATSATNASASATAAAASAAAAASSATAPAPNSVNTTHLVNGAVTLAKMAPFSATKLLLGRNSANAGVPEEVTLNQLLDWVGGTAQGDILYRSNTGWARLAAGTNGQFLKTQGAGANPTWATVAAATFTQGYVRGLVVENNTTWSTAINVTASEVVLTDGNGKTCKVNNISMTGTGYPASGQANPTTPRYVFGGAGDGAFGGGTWVYGYLIADGAGNYGFVWSSSYSKPSISAIVANGYTEYTGWTFYKLLTAQYIKSNGDNLPMYQRENVIQWKQWVSIASGATGSISSPTWTAVGILGAGYAAPPDAITFMGTLYSNTGGTNCMVAPNAGFGAFGSSTNGPPVGINTPGGNGGTYVPFEFVMESANIYWATPGGSDRLISRGYTLNL